jgi:hypothetical protein
MRCIKTWCEARLKQRRPKAIAGMGVVSPLRRRTMGRRRANKDETEIRREKIRKLVALCHVKS